MNTTTKITLSDKELELACNTDWILTKHSIIQKVYELFGSLSEDMQRLVLQQPANLPLEATTSSPKISKGENYERLPYVMLDYPRCFKKEKTLAIRTMFWWGHFFSIHFQLSGKCKEETLPSLMDNFLQLQQKGYSICISSDPWQHHFDSDNYKLLSACSKEEFSSIANREPFIKIGKKLSLQQWKEAPLFIEQAFKEMLLLLKN